MSGIDPEIIWSVARLYVEFTMPGETISASGTGFFVRRGDDSFYITNRHNVDPTLKFTEYTPYRLTQVRIVTHQKTDRRESPERARYDVPDFAERLVCHPAADVACFVNPLSYARPKPHNFTVPHVNFSDLADEAFFRDELSPMDTASFIGYPSWKGEEWVDRRWGAPIARAASIASVPELPFEHDDIKTPDTVLVSGLSFNGSSGSPVISHQKGLPTGDGITGPFTPPRLIGIMTGSWKDSDKEAALKPPSMFQHSGLSFFTRATSILELLNTIEDPAH